MRFFPLLAAFVFALFAPPASAQLYPQPGVPYSFPVGLDPYGDNFLALRSLPTTVEGVRIARLGPDALFTEMERYEGWVRVRVSNGQSGWVYGGYVACCRMIEEPVVIPVPVPVAPVALVPVVPVVPVIPVPVPVAPARVAPPVFTPDPVVATPTPQTCQALWMERNAIFKAAGYCFRTQRAIETFGNAGCQFDDEADVPLSTRQRERALELKDAEVRRCRP